MSVRVATLQTPPCSRWAPQCALPRASGIVLMAAATYSLWIKPYGSVAKKLSQEIATQAKEFGGSLFEPHVTLLPDIQGNESQIAAKSKDLAAKIKKFRINFLDVSQGTTFHRCVYILVAKERSIMEAGETARKEFDLPSDYMPHLSLLYADIPAGTKDASQQQAVQRLYGKNSDYSTLLTDNGFTAEAVSLWYTPIEDKTLVSWRQIAEFPLAD